MTDNIDEKHLDVYENRYELHDESGTRVYYQGFQNEETQRRYAKINETLAAGYLTNKINSLKNVDFSELSESNQKLLRNMDNMNTKENSNIDTIKDIATITYTKVYEGTPEVFRCNL